MCTGHILKMCTGHILKMCTGHILKMCTGHILKIKQNIKNIYMRRWSLTHIIEKKKYVKVSLVHAMEAHTGWLGKAPLTLNLGSTQRWMVNSRRSCCTPSKEPQYPMNKRLGVAHRPGWPFWITEKSLSLTRIQTLDHPAHNPVTMPSKPSSSPPTSSANN